MRPWAPCTIHWIPISQMGPAKSHDQSKNNLLNLTRLYLLHPPTSNIPSKLCMLKSSRHSCLCKISIDISTTWYWPDDFYFLTFMRMQEICTEACANNRASFRTYISRIYPPLPEIALSLQVVSTVRTTHVRV